MLKNLDPAVTILLLIALALLVCGSVALYAVGQAGGWVATATTGAEHTWEYYLVRTLILMLCCGGPITLGWVALLRIVRRRS